VRWTGVPRIVAEALAPVPDPVVTALRPGEWRPAAQIARAMARRLAPDQDAAPPPEWLRPHQVRSFRRTLYALRRYGGALLADPVGSGKTYVALAVAAAIAPRRPIACLVPASLVPQWRATARALGVEIVTASHQAVSRRRLPPLHRGPVVIDEAHHFRSPTTRRYRHAAPWLMGRPVLLVTATPVVNRLTDLLHQLLLGIRDDALAPDGVASLRGLLGRGASSPALGRVVVEGLPPQGLRPSRRVRTSPPGGAECQAAEAALASLDRLRLSPSPGTEALVRSVLRRGLASSPAALSAALRRYRNLLLHARDAAAAGRRLDRAAIRRFAGELEDQLVLWELLPAGGDPHDLLLDDLDRVDEVLRQAVRAEAEADGKVERLRAILADGRPTLVFTSRRETVRYLRDRLAPPLLAWCTGARAGLGHSPMPRATVLGWFRQGERPAPPDVRHLLVTDVAAEGLDLQRAARVIHYDLPWTPMRLEQREGRALRLGSLHGSVEVVTFDPGPAIERALRVTRTIASKARLPARAGLGLAGRGLWRWRSELADAYADGEGAPGAAIVPRGPPGVLALFELHVAGHGRGRLSAALVWVTPGGEWTEDEAVVAERLSAAVTAPPADPDPLQLREALALLGAPIRSRLALARGSRWAVPAADCAAHQVSSRLHQAIRDAARRRDLGELAGLERALAFVGRGHTAGERFELERLAELPERAFKREALRLAAPGIRWDTIEPRLVGVLLFAP
jgi:superfamily II DNA or RNA helicase